METTRNEELTAMLTEVSKAAGYAVRPGDWIRADNGFAYRFDVCGKCGIRYANKRKRGLQMSIHNWWHYCTKKMCSACHAEKRVPSMDYAKALAEVREAGAWIVR